MAVRSTQWPLSRGLLLLSIALYIACLPLKAFCSNPEFCNSSPSWVLLVFGWMGMAFGKPVHFIWLANPLLLITWVMVIVSETSLNPATKHVAIAASIATNSLGSSFLLANEILMIQGGAPSPILRL